MKRYWDKLVKSIYDWCMNLVAGPYALAALLVIAFAESSFFPIPPDLLLIPLILARRTQAFKIAFYTTAASVIGGWFGYAIGWFLYDSVGVKVLDFYHYRTQFEQFCGAYNQWGAWIVFGAGITPFPYKIITIASGVTHLDWFVFTIASIVSRGIRFFLIAWLLYKYGTPMKAYIEKNLGWLSVLFLVLLFGGFMAVKWL
ncbi:MAG: YqaA family protein [Alphaproteobacteria bacterium]